MFWRKQQINALQGLARPTQAYLDSLVGPRGEELEAGKGALTLAFPRLDEVNNFGIGHLGVGGVGFGDGVAGGGHGNALRCRMEAILRSTMTWALEARHVISPWLVMLRCTFSTNRRLYCGNIDIFPGF